MNLKIDDGDEVADWRCESCKKLLGRRRGNELQIRMGHHAYVVSLPVKAICYNCRAPKHRASTSGDDPPV